MTNQERKTKVLSLRKKLPQDQVLKNSLDVCDRVKEQIDALVDETLEDTLSEEEYSLYRFSTDKTESKKSPVSLNILCFYPMTGEVDLRKLYDSLIDCGHNLYFPITNPKDCSMEFYKVSDLYDFTEGSYGVMEPKNTKDKFDSPDKTLIICPGVIFDRKLNRCGFGKGYYDRYLNRFKNLKRIAVGFEFQIFEEIETKDWDIPMDILISERRTYYKLI